ncbi:MAG: Fe-S protein assembly co-chaperone HscB [Planctomycetota bacterium]
MPLDPSVASPHDKHAHESAGGAGVISRCHECGSSLVSPLVCLGCTRLQPAETHFNHFSRLGISLGFDILNSDVEMRYLVLARGLHPDQFAQRPKPERDLAEILSAQLNDSYKTLSDPIRRGEYLLELLGGPSRDQDKRTPKAFLVEMLELNEEIEEAQHDPARLDEIKNRIVKRLDAASFELSPAFREAIAADASATGADAIRKQSILLKIREILNVCAYLQSLAAQINEIKLR